jgi:hypothetical protein
MTFDPSFIHFDQDLDHQPLSISNDLYIRSDLSRRPMKPVAGGLCGIRADRSLPRACLDCGRTDNFSERASQAEEVKPLSPSEGPQHLSPSDLSTRDFGKTALSATSGPFHQLVESHFHQLTIGCHVIVCPCTFCRPNGCPIRARGL